ncbi:hypothetical protein CH361_18505 [Leptospira brenneri]|nr:hypothetical protein CH361_18505 [Leptospira brenneri]
MEAVQRDFPPLSSSLIETPLLLFRNKTFLSVSVSIAKLVALVCWNYVSLVVDKKWNRMSLEF